MNEVWRDIKGYEGLYKLRIDGLLHALPKKHRRIEYTYGIEKKGHLQVSLSKDGVEKTKEMHRLLYETFIGPIPEDHVVHHKNFIGTDNRLENLELLSKSEHSKLHSNENVKEQVGRLIKANSKQIIQYTKNGEFVAEYPSVMEASRTTGVHHCNIILCCKGNRKTAGGFIWKYK